MKIGVINIYYMLITKQVKVLLNHVTKSKYLKLGYIIESSEILVNVEHLPIKSDELTIYVLQKE